MNLKNLHSIAYNLYRMNIPILPQMVYYFQFLLFNSSVPYKCKIGNNTKFAYGGIGVVIHERSIIGDHCIIGQGITIGGKSKVYEVPRIGNHVYIAAGSRIIGDVTIGNNVIIGANAVVVKDVPDGCMVAGIPAKIIKTDIMVENYV